MLPYDSYKRIANTIQKCWNYDCDEDCGWYDWDDGFQCKRYRSFYFSDQFFKDSLEALDKRIEKDVVKQEKYLCPSCGASLTTTGSKYCCECGQKLRWSNVEFER